MTTPIVPSPRKNVASSPGTRGATPSSLPHMVSQPQIKKIVQDIQACIVEMKTDFEDNKQPINDDSQTLHRFCAKLEYLLQFGMKDKFTLMGKKKDYWDYFCDCLGSTKGANDGIKYVKTIGDYKMSMGKGRAFLRFCLMHGRMPDTLQQCVMNGKATSDWYQSKSVWLQHEDRNNLISALYDLNDLQFDLAPRGYDLDNAWPSFARKNLAGVYNWNLSTMSRTSSMSSLTSIPIQESPYKYGMSPNESADLDHLASESMHSDLLDKVEALEQQKLSFQQSVIGTQGELDRLKKEHSELTAKHESLSTDHSQLLRKCDEQSLTAEAKSKEWDMKESMYTKQLELAQTECDKLQVKVDSLEGKVIGLDSSRKDSDVSNMSRIAELEKTKGDLQLQVRILQQDLDTSQSSNSKSSEVIKSLEDKLEVMGQKNRELLNKMEDMVDNKHSSASNTIDTASKLQEAVVSLKEAESENISLQATNKELTNQCARKDEELENMKIKLTQSESELKGKIEQLQNDSSNLNETLGQERNNHIETVENLQSEKSSLKEELKTQQANFQNEKESLLTEKKQREEDIVKLKEQERCISEKLAKITKERKTEHDNSQKCLVAERDRVLKLENQITELKQNLNLKEKSVTELTDTVSDLNSQVSDSEKKHREVDAVRQSLVSKLEGKENEVRSLQEQHSLEKGSADEVKGALQEKMAAIRELETQERQLRDILQWVNSSAKAGDFDNSPLRLEDEDFVKIIDNLVQQFKDKQHKIETLNTEQKTLSEKCQHLQQETAEQGKQLSDTQENVNTLNISLKNSQDEESKMHQKCSEFEQNLEQMKLEKTEMVKKLQEKDSELTKVVENCETFKKEVAKLQKNLNEKTNEALEMRDRVSKSDEKLQQSSANFKEVKGQKQGLSEKLKEKEKLLTLQTESAQRLQKDFEVLQDQVQCLEKEQERLLSEKSENDKLIGKLKSKGKELISSNEKLKQNVSELTNEKKVAEEKITELKTQVFDVEQRLQKVTSSKDDEEKDHQDILSRLQTERQNLTEKLEESLTDLGSIRDQLNETSIQLENAYTAKDKMESERQMIMATKSDLENKISTLENKCHALEERLEKKDNDFTDLTNRFRNLEAEKQTADTEITKMASELQALHTAISKANIEQEKYQSNIENLEEDLKLKCSNYSQEIQTLQEKLSKQEEELQTKQTEWEMSEKTLETNKSELSQKNIQIDEMAEQNRKSNEKIEELEKMVLEKSGDVTRFENELKTKIEELQLEKDTVKQELSALQFQLSAEQIQHEEALQSFMSHDNNITDMKEKLQEQEALIEQLEHEMNDIKCARQKEAENQQTEVENLRLRCDSKDTERKSLKEKLDKKNKELEDEKLLVISLKSQLSTAVERQRESGKETETEISQLRNDTVQLKKQLIKLIKEKDSLWKKSDRLAFEQKIQVQDKWMDNKDVTHCLGCNAEFSFTLRKHHCRLCGKIFCYQCSDNWIQTAHSSKKSRACNSCMMRHSQIEAKANSPEGNGTDDELEKTIELPHRSFRRPPPDMSESTTSTNSTGDMESISAQEDEVIDKGEEPVAMVPGQVATDITISLVGQNETDEVKQVKKEGKEPGDTEGATADLSNKDEIFHLISDEEISKSLSLSVDTSVPISDPSITSSLQISTEELEKGEVNRNNEVWIKPGKKFAVPICVDRVNTVLCWEFSTQPKDIVFSVLYQEDGVTPISKAQTLVPSCKCDSHKQAVKGELMVKQLGIYTLMFDNTYSRLTSKQIMYSLWSK